MLEEIRKESLSSSIARAIKVMIDRKGFRPGDKLPPINEMATQFKVGAPTLREALRQLQAIGIVEMRHGSGVYVADNHDALFVANPIRPRNPSRKTMGDLIDVRLMIEAHSTGLAAGRVTDAEIREMAELLDQAEAALQSDDMHALMTANMEFHGAIARVSGNTVVHQMLGLLAGLFRSEQYAILQIYGSPLQDLAEHRGILDALTKRDPELAATRMRAHLQGVKEVISNGNLSRK